MLLFVLSSGLGLITVLVTSVYLYFTWIFGYWNRRGVPHLTPIPIFGDFKDLLLLKKTAGDQLTDIYNKFHGFGLGGFFISNEPALLIRDPQFISEVLIKHFENFTDRNIYTNPDNDPLFAKGVFLQRGVNWKQLHHIFSPSFTPAKVKSMYNLIRKCGEELIEEIDKYAVEKQPLNVNDIISRFSCDTIAACAFGVQGNCLKDPDSEFRQLLKKIFYRSLGRMWTQIGMFFYPKLVKLFKIPFIQKDVKFHFKSMVNEMIKNRERNYIVRKDFLDLIMKQMPKGKARGDYIGNQSGTDLVQGTEILVNDEDVLFAQAMSFYVAGSEMASNVITFALYELSHFQDVQKKLADEIDDVLKKHDGDISYNAIQDMKYLDMVVAETLRKYPVQTFVDRNCTRDFTIPGTNVVVEKGTGVFVSIYGLHHDPQYYPDPEKFDPERFSDENKHTRSSYAYLPFGEGPRKCIAYRFGMQQVKAGIVHALSQHDILPCEEAQGPVLMTNRSVLLSMKDNFFVKPRRRN